MGAGSAVEALGTSQARLAQSAERKALNLVVVGSSPKVGAFGALPKGWRASGKLTAVGFEPTPFRNGALSHRLRPLGQTVIKNIYQNVRLTVPKREDAHSVTKIVYTSRFVRVILAQGPC